jgi:exopolysaccharide production protein ExoQ
MIFWLAFLICSTGIAGLFFLDRDASTRNSKALWLPVMWLWIAGSRPVSMWLGGSGGSGLNATLEGSPMDAAIFAALMVAGIIVVFLRRHRAIALLKANGPVLIYLLYCMISVAWSPFPEPAFKRWTKDVGDLVMVLVLVTDGQPIAALRRLYSRIGFILFPASILLIRYTELGRGYDPDGNPMNTGVTTNKNSLGLIVFIVSLGALWNVRALLIDKEAPNRGRRLVAQGTLLAFGLTLLEMAHSATSVACFILGGGLMLATSLRVIRNHPGRVRALCVVIVLVGGLSMLFGGGAMVSDALGRGDKMSGRTDIWAAAIAAAGNPIIGTGFESFWNAHAREVARSLVLKGFLDMPDLVSAHNGYIEVYLDLGWVGVSLIALILISGYRNASKAFQRDPEFGSLILAYVTTSTFYSITEAGFRVLTPSWIFLLLAVVSARGVAAGFFGGEEPKIIDSRGGTASRMPAGNKLIPARKTVYANRRGFTQFEISRADNLR